MHTNLIEISKEIRKFCLIETFEKKRGHLGGTFSCVEILVSLYYSNLFSLSSKNNLDKFILSKGHACLGLYYILFDLGIISKKTLNSYGLDGGMGAQLDININGVDWNTGSLGHSIGVSTGLAMGQESGNYTITVIGDAECYEGSVWESIVLAGEKNIENLIVIVDRNRLSVTEELGDESFFKCYKDSLTSLGWHFDEIDGHNFDQIISSLKECKSINKPSLIIANTIKGKGISFMENKKDWHHSVPNEKEIKLAVDSL